MIVRRLQDEVESRVESLRETADNDGVPTAQLERTALEDIVELSAEDHGAYTQQERRMWSDLQRAARKRLAAQIKEVP